MSVKRQRKRHVSSRISTAKSGELKRSKHQFIVRSDAGVFIGLTEFFLLPPLRACNHIPLYQRKVEVVPDDIDELTSS